jgi:15-cis-phytoene synthase
MPARPDSSAFRALALLYSPPAQRPLLAALLALEREIGASLRRGLDHQVAHTRLAWWREECGRCAQGHPGHPLTREIAARADRTARPALAGLAGLVDCAQWDLAAATFETRPELRAYCERWSVAVIEPLARSATTADAADRARELGRSLRELELLLALRDEARAGRIRLPLDELAGAHTTTTELSRSPWPAALVQLLRERHRQLRAALAASVDALAPAGQPPLRGLIVWAAVASAHSARVTRDLPGAHPPRDPQRLLDGWRAWRAARRADAGRCRLRAD